MESRLNIDSDRVEMLEKQLREARDLAAESDRKFEEVMISSFYTKKILGVVNKKIRRNIPYQTRPKYPVLSLFFFSKNIYLSPNTKNNIIFCYYYHN